LVENKVAYRRYLKYEYLKMATNLNQMFKTKKKLKITLISIVAIVLIIMLITPTLIKNYIIHNSIELAGRKINIAHLKYNYFTSTVKVYDFKMFEENGTDHFTTFDTLVIDLEPLKLMQDKIEIEQIYLRGLMVKTVMKDSSFNFDDLIAFHNAKDSIDIKNEEALKFSISNIELKDANIYFDNQNVGKETDISDFSFAIPYVGWDQQEKSNADLTFNFENGGYFQTKLNINPVDGEFDAQVNVSDLSLKPFYEYVLEYADINDFDGVLNSQIVIKGNTNDAIKSIISGHVEVDDFKMIDKNNTLFLGAKKISSDLKAIDYYNNSYSIKNFDISQSYTFFQLDSTSNNFFRIFKIEEDQVTSIDTDEQSLTETASETSSAELPDINYTIENLSLNNGVLDYTDNLTGQPFNYHLSQVKIDSDSISNTSKWLDIYATMLLNERGTLKADLGINPNNYYNSTLDISVENFLLPDLNIYTNYYMGHSLLNGDMYYISKSKISDGQIQSENKLLVNNASLENTKKGLYSLPLKFAFFLLTDKNGDVKLDIPVRGDLNDPQVNVGKIVWQTFKNVIGKTVAAPVNFLVGLVGGDPKELEELEFTFNDTIPSEKQYRQLNKLLDLEQKKEELKITMTYYVDKKLQKEAISAENTGKQFNEATGKDYLKNETDYSAYLVNKIGNDSLSTVDIIKELSKTIPTDSMATERSKNLIKTVSDYLKMEYPATIITVVQGKSEAPENSGAYPKFLITYGLLDEEDSTSDSTKENNTTETITKQ
jgi:hypothetical protein